MSVMACETVVLVALLAGLGLGFLVGTVGR